MDARGLDLEALAERLTRPHGVVAVLLGGSRARGDHRADSDIDLGLYYRGDVDTQALQQLADEMSPPSNSVPRPAVTRPAVTRPGERGPWVDGGAWLSIGGVPVDWIYRDLDRVHGAWARTQRGEFEFHAQAGHPLSVSDFAYVGEVALGVVLADPTGELTALRETLHYPESLTEALVRGLWEADFLVTIARKGAARGDTAYVVLCLSRAVLLCAHALHGVARRWLVNEKGAVAAASRLQCAPTGFADRAHAVLSGLGTRPATLHAGVDAAAQLVREVSEVREVREVREVSDTCRLG